MINKNAIDPHALTIFRMLKSAGFSAYFVGGAVRDLLLGQSPKDFDIATNATPHQIKRVIPHGKIIGRRFRHVMLEKESGRYEIVTFRGPVVEKDDAGKARKRYPDLNQFGNAEQDASRRDFTINALFYDPDSDELVDYVGGKVDVENRLVRTIGNAVDRMKDDPIRILRAIRHKVKLNLNYSTDVKDAIAATAQELNTTSKDRIREEVLKVCMDRSLGKFLTECRRINVLDQFAPWFSELNEEEWQNAEKLWECFVSFNSDKDLDPQVGLTVMMYPVVKKVIRAAFEERISKEKREEGMLPDMKFFLGSDKVRTWLLRVLRISKIQTDTVLRSCFYAERMTGRWLTEGGPPKRVEGRLRQQNGAYIGAFIASLILTSRSEEIPGWISALSANLWKRSNAPRADQQISNQGRPKDANRNDRNDRHDRSDRNDRGDRNDRNSSRNFGRSRSKDRGGDDSNYEAPTIALPVLEHPLEWNGPLHSPALRPIFNDSHPSHMLHQGKALPYRPSGIPLPPVDRAIESSYVVKNYKPEFPATTADEGENSESEGSSRKDNSHNARKKRDNNRNRNSEQSDHRRQSNSRDEDSSSNYNSDFDGSEDFDEDSIGNKIDGPETSGYRNPLDTGYVDDSQMLTSHIIQSRTGENKKQDIRNNRGRSGKSRGRGRRGSKKRTSTQS